MATGIFDPYYVAEVLSDLLSRQRGREVKIVLTPKDPGEGVQPGIAGESANGGGRMVLPTKAASGRII